MGTSLNDPTASNNYDLVGSPDGRQAMTRKSELQKIGGWAATYAIMNTVRLLQRVLTDSWMRLSVSVSTEFVCSSRITIFGFCKKTRARAIRCFSPPESFLYKGQHSISHINYKLTLHVLQSSCYNLGNLLAALATANEGLNNQAWISKSYCVSRRLCKLHTPHHYLHLAWHSGYYP
jgi:hypothetical protein